MIFVFLKSRYSLLVYCIWSLDACELMCRIWLVNLGWFKAPTFSKFVAVVYVINMATEQVLSFSIASMVENVLQQRGTRLSDRGLASRKADESCMINHFLIYVWFSMVKEISWILSFGFFDDRRKFFLVLSWSMWVLQNFCYNLTYVGFENIKSGNLWILFFQMCFL